MWKRSMLTEAREKNKRSTVISQSIEIEVMGWLVGEMNVMHRYFVFIKSMKRKEPMN